MLAPSTHLLSSISLQVYAGSNKGVLADVDLLQRITQTSRAAVREFVKDRTGLDGRIGTNYLTQFIKFTGLYVDPWVRALQVSSRWRLWWRGKSTNVHTDAMSTEDAFVSCT